MRNDSQSLRLDLFEKIGLKVDENDPIIQLYLLQEAIMLDVVKNHQSNLNDLGNAMIYEIKDTHKLLLTDFDHKKNDLNNILTKLDKQKEAIVSDVWLKLDKKISDKIHRQLSEDMQAIANNANNKINNQRNLLIGGIMGLLIGFILGVILFIFK